MRYLLLSLVVISVLVSSTGTSLAQTVGPAQQQIVGVYLQIVVQDSSGNLLSYLETSRIIIDNPAKFNQLIDQNMNMFTTSTITVNGQNLEILKVNDTIVHPYNTIVSQNLVSVSTPTGYQVLVSADHDGYPVVKGDKVISYWTIIRTAPS